MKIRKIKKTLRRKFRTGSRSPYVVSVLAAFSIVALSGFFIAQSSAQQATTSTQTAATKSKTAPEDYAAKAAASMQSFLSPKTQRWSGWWTSANAMTALIDYMDLSGSREYFYVIDQVYSANSGEKFINSFYDDMAWWGLAWLRAYDITKDAKYLNSSKYIADYMYDKGWDKKCGGGVYWKKQEGKFAVENELFIKLAAGIHNRSLGDTKYLGLAKKDWDWFIKSGMINTQNLVNDGLDSKDCKNNNGVTWSYNQGTILGAAVEMYKATNDRKYLTKATQLATASMADLSKGNKGIVKEKIAPACGKCTTGNEMAFKGVYTRNLRELEKAIDSSKIRSYLAKNANSAWNEGRGPSDIVGFHWQGPYDRAGSVNQQSALDLFNSQIKKKLPINIAKGKSASGSPSCDTIQVPKAALDGTAKTKWCSKMPASGEVSMTINLGAKRTIKRIRILHAGAGAEKREWNTRDFDVLMRTSTTGPWKRLVKVRGNSSSGTVHTIKSAKTQFLRINILDAGADKVARIYEFSVE